MGFEKLPRQGMAEKIIENVKSQIVNKTLQPGVQLPSEEKLAAQLGVGRGTVREALRVLVHLGFLERRSSGTYVSQTAVSNGAAEEVARVVHRYHEYMEIIEARRVVEPELAALAAVRATPEQLEVIADAYRQMASAGTDIERFTEDDNRFHAAIFVAAGNKLFMDFMKSIQSVIRDNQAQVLRNSGIAPRSLEYHGGIVEAIRDGNPDLARARMLSHVSDIEREMRHIFKQRKAE